MPDLITHAATGQLFGRAFRLDRWIVPLTIGSALPDVMARLPVRIMGEMYYRTGWPSSSEWYWLFSVLHLPIGAVLSCYVISMFFEQAIRRQTFLALAAGALGHIALDSAQSHYSGGSPLLWPLSWEGYELGWMSPEASLKALPYVVVVSVSVELWRRWRRTRPPAANA